MKKPLSVMLALVIAGCASRGSDIDAVKNGVLDFNKTLTIGQALDNWKNCNKSEWSEFTSDNGVKVVQFTCDQSMKEYMSKLQSLIPPNSKFAAALPNADTKTFQFTMNKDGTFQLDNVSDLTKWADGTENEQSQNPMDQIKSAYRNKMEYDMSDVDGLQQGNSDSEAAAQMLAVAYSMGKMSGKKGVASSVGAAPEPTTSAVSAGNTTQPDAVSDAGFDRATCLADMTKASEHGDTNAAADVDGDVAGCSAIFSAGKASQPLPQDVADTCSEIVHDTKIDKGVVLPPLCEAELKNHPEWSSSN